MPTRLYGAESGARIFLRGMNQAFWMSVVERADMAFSECWSCSVYIPIIPGYTEQVELIAGLKCLCVLIFVSV